MSTYLFQRVLILAIIMLVTKIAKISYTQLKVDLHVHVRYYNYACIKCSQFSHFVEASQIHCVTLISKKGKYCSTQICTLQYCTVLYYTVLYCTVLYCTILYYTIQYSTVFNFYFIFYFFLYLFIIYLFIIALLLID